MSYNNPFFLPIESYKRDFDIVGNYHKKIATYLSSTRSMDYKAALEFVKRKCREPESPSMNMLRRKPRHDRKKTKGDLLSYVNWVSSNEHVLTPNLICYANPKVEVSYVAGFIDVNLATRSKVKKEGQAAGQAGDKVFAEFCGLLQANYKLRNNSISGATSSPFNPLYYGSAHTSLTSTCRVITSTANSINEKMLSSNRHYFSPLVTMENILYIATNSDLGAIQEILYDTTIVVPEVEYVYNQILESSRKYWKSDVEEAKILRLLQGLTPVQLTAVCYCGDLRAIIDNNDTFMRELYTKIMAVPSFRVDNPKEVIKNADGDIKALAGMCSSEFTAGKKIDALEPEYYSLYASRIKHIADTMEDYGKFFKAFITTTLMPSHLHSLPTMLRDSVVASDTDSSIFSMQRQVKWFTGKMQPGTETTSVSAVTTYFASQNIAHSLGILCAQIGTKQEELFRCTMKNEFSFPVFVVTSRTKHYMALMDACEGNVYDKNHSEIKGVNLKNSKLPPKIRELLLDYQVSLMEYVAAGNQLVPMNVIAPIGYIEHHILDKVLTGDATFYRYEQAKTRETYARPESSNFQLITLWNNVFGLKYGTAEQLPAPCVKLPVKLHKRVDIENFAATLPEQMGNAFLRHCADWKKDKFSNLLVPVDLLKDNKIPEEMLSIIDTRKILRSMMAPFYLTSECYGLCAANTRDTRFYSDMYSVDDVKDDLIIDVSDLD